MILGGPLRAGFGAGLGLVEGGRVGAWEVKFDLCWGGETGSSSRSASKIEN